MVRAYPTSDASRLFALIPAAGVGQRMGTSIPKQYLQLAGKPVLQHVIDVFVASHEIEHVFIVLSPTDAWIDDYIVSGKIQIPEKKVTLLRCGGSTRRISVLQGLEVISHDLSLKDWILVHDAARPGLTTELVTRLVKELEDDPVGGLLALPVVDTVKLSKKASLETVPREGLWLAQTPQMFRYGTLIQALQEHPDVTDEAGAIEAMGFVPRLVKGHLSNNKITNPDDMTLVELFLKTRKTKTGTKKRK